MKNKKVVQLTTKELINKLKTYSKFTSECSVANNYIFIKKSAWILAMIIDGKVWVTYRYTKKYLNSLGVPRELIEIISNKGTKHSWWRKNKNHKRQIVGYFRERSYSLESILTKIVDSIILKENKYTDDDHRLCCQLIELNKKYKEELKENS